MSTTTDPQRTSLPVVSLAPGASGLGRNIDYELFMDCVHCGLCLGSCPTYVETGNENDSPRGRIYLWRAVTDGRAELSSEVRKHLDLCLECRACETACPSGVQYGQIISSYKKDMAKLGPAAPSLGWLQRWMLFHLTPYAQRMRWALMPLRLLQTLGLRGLVDRMGGLLPASLRRMQQIVPPGWRRTMEHCPRSCRPRAPASARGAADRLRRRRLLPANDPGHGARAAEERLRSMDSAGSGLLRSAALSFRAGCAGEAIGDRQLHGVRKGTSDGRCDHQQRRRLRPGAEGVRPSPGGYARGIGGRGVRPQGARHPRVPRRTGADQADASAEDQGDLPRRLWIEPRPEDPRRSLDNCWR